MKKQLLLIVLVLTSALSFSQNVGIVRKNYVSTYFDSLLMMNVDVLDSSTIRLGSIDPFTGVVTNIGSSEYTTAINFTGATVNPYFNHYYICSGTDILTFDINSGNIINRAPVTGSIPSFAFQNFRFNPSDSVVYGLIPCNYYSTYFDSVLMMDIDVLDSTQIRFASINPNTGQFTVIGSSSFTNLYTLGGNSIDPYQMLYYYSAVDTLVGIDLYTGSEYSAVPIQLPAYTIFENIAYSCVDTSIYGIARQNYVSTVYDSLLMDFVEIVDSVSFKLSKIDPSTGVVTVISPANIGSGGNLTGGAFIDPITRTFYFNDGRRIFGISLITGQVNSILPMSFNSGAFAMDMMRNTQNCYGASRIRFNSTTSLESATGLFDRVICYPNPSQTTITFETEETISSINILDFKGSSVLESIQNRVDISSLPSGIYFAKISTVRGQLLNTKFIKN